MSRHRGREVVCPGDGQPRDDEASGGTQLSVQVELLGLTDHRDNRGNPRRNPDDHQGPREGPGQRIRIPGNGSTKRSRLRSDQAASEDRARGADGAARQMEKTEQ